jgi:hypothetical protein
VKDPKSPQGCAIEELVHQSPPIHFTGIDKVNRVKRKFSFP